MYVRDLPSYQKWDQTSSAGHGTNPEETEKTSFGYRPKISFVVPLYKTPEKYLRRLTESFQEQTYSNWELCFLTEAAHSHRDVGIVKRTDSEG